MPGSSSTVDGPTTQHQKIQTQNDLAPKRNAENFPQLQMVLCCLSAEM